jgi:hypothetical protein
MDRINHSTATPDRKFTAGNPATPIPATVVTPELMNQIQEELIAPILASGQELDPEDNTQLLQAILALIAANAPTPELATEEAAGIIRLSSTAQALAGEDDTSAMSPADVKAAIAANGVSLEQILMYS